MYNIDFFLDYNFNLEDYLPNLTPSKKPLYFFIFYKILYPQKKRTYKKSKALFNKLMPTCSNPIINFIKIPKVPLEHKFKMKQKP